MRNFLTFLAGIGCGLSPVGNLPMKLFFSNVKDVPTCLNWLNNPQSIEAKIACYPADPNQILVMKWLFIIVGLILLVVAVKPLFKDIFKRQTV